jgi:hypothetical protein
MKALKLIAYGLLALTGIYVVFCFVGPADLGLQRSTLIQAPAASIFPHVADFAQWKDWSPWQKSDPAMTNELSGTAGSVGHKTTWKSKKEGDGSQEIIEITPESSIKMKLVFREDPNNPAFSDWKFEGDSLKTNVTWGFKSGGIPFLFRGIVYLMGVQKMMVNYTDQGLADLKKVVEGK